MLRSMPFSTSRVRPMCWKLLVRFSMMTSASATFSSSLVADPVHRAQEACGDGGVEGGERRDEQRADRDDQVVGRIDRNRQAIDVIDLGIELHAQPTQALGHDVAGDHAE